MAIESKRAVAVDNVDIMESLCHTCAYSGCTNCPSLVPVRGRIEKIEDYPQIEEAVQLENGKIVTRRCKKAVKRNTKKLKPRVAPSKVFDWDPKQRKFVKVIK